MGKPDSLSRCADHGDGKEDNAGITLLKLEKFAIRALEGLQIKGPERELLEEVKRGNREGHMEDVVARAWKELAKSNSKLGGILYFQDRIYVPRNTDLRRCIVELHHDTQIAGHPGWWKTLELISRNYWWPQMARYISYYCQGRDMCLRTKVQRRAPAGELQPIPTPQRRWEEVTMDFIIELPESAGYDVIMVAVDRLSKRAHFIPTHTTITAMGTA
ncbi:hypothetical protein AX17_006150 [Amanita inopinata Kibby_2008]|nr:hypothetical protein AX17_006150 [Amanita inopinata Kibby_2008]